MVKCQSLANLVVTIASRPKTLKIHNPVVTNSNTTSQLVRVPCRNDLALLTVGAALLLTKLRDCRFRFDLSCLTRAGHGSDLVSRHSGKLTTCLFMFKTSSYDKHRKQPLTTNHLST